MKFFPRGSGTSSKQPWWTSHRCSSPWSSTVQLLFGTIPLFVDFLRIELYSVQQYLLMEIYSAEIFGELYSRIYSKHDCFCLYQGKLSDYLIAQIMVLGWPWPILCQSQIWSKVKVILFLKTFAAFGLHGGIDLFHIVISLSLAARYLARFRVTSQAWGKQ